MCLEPILRPDGAVIRCRKCKQCIDERINDWVGRCIAESQTSVATFSVTLTYGARFGVVDHERATVLTYSDVQKYLKRLRFGGFPVRYFAVGELGTMKGRAHWHLVLFFKDQVPDHRIGERFQERHWTHGFSHWDSVSARSLRYVCKYLRKDHKGQSHLMMSKKPPLGDEYFRQRAVNFVQQGLAPQDAFYRFHGVHGPNGGTYDYFMQGVTRDNFCKYFSDAWEKMRGGHPPVSPLIEEWFERQPVSDKWHGNVATETRTKRQQDYRTAVYAIRSDPEKYLLAKRRTDPTPTKG